MRGSDAVTVGIDIGTTSVKAIAVDGGGSVVARARIPHERCVPRPGRYEHDADAAWRVGPARALDALGPVGASAVSVTAMVPSLTAVDAAGTPVSPGLLYGDERGESAPGEMLSGEAVGFLRWTVRASPDAAGVWPAQAVANHALCGEAAISDVAAISLWPLSNGETWDGDVVRRVGGRVEALPRIVPTGTPIGRHDGMVVDAGSIDAVCEQLVAGADDDGDVLVICGASLVVWITAAVRREVPGLWTMARGRDGRTTIGGVSNAGGIFLDWVDALAGGRAPEEDRPLDPCRIPVWAPYPRGERTPLHDPLRRARLADLDLTHDTSALQRAAYEASAFVVRRHVEMSGVTARRIVATGGGTRRAEWMQALADCTGLRVDASAVAESAALGAAFLARVAAGLESDMTAARNWARTGERYSPRDEWCTAADARYRRFLELSPRTEPTPSAVRSVPPAPAKETT